MAGQVMAQEISAQIRHAWFAHGFTRTSVLTRFFIFPDDAGRRCTTHESDDFRREWTDERLPLMVRG